METLRLICHSLTIATLLLIASVQSSQAVERKLTCKTEGSGFQISIEGGEMLLIGVDDASKIKQSCLQIASKLEQEINSQGLDKLMLVADSIGRQDSICVVRSDRGACRKDESNFILSVPDKINRQQFLDSMLKVNVDSFFSGSAGQHTNRRYYARLGKALYSTLSR
jgi:preprotein translocase subunit SecD